MGNVVERLLKEEHIVEIRPPRYRESQLPEIDYSLFHPESREAAREQISWWQQYLCTTHIIIYDIQDNRERHHFENYLICTYGQEASELIRSSGLTVHRNSSAIAKMGLLLEDMIEPNLRIKEISEEMTLQFYGRYSDLPLDRKIQLVEQIQDRVYEILEILAVKSPTSVV